MILRWAKTVGRHLRRVNPVYLLIAAVLSLGVCINALRTNNLTMVKLREAVYTADKNNGDVQGSLSKLQHYVVTHMNTDLTPSNNAVYPPIQLVYTYERLQLAEAQKQNNDQVYSDAQSYCEGQNSTDFSGRNRVQCIEDYVLSHGAQATPNVPDSLYKFDFLSPSWSPDLAGWSMVTTILLLLSSVGLFIVRGSKKRS